MNRGTLFNKTYLPDLLEERKKNLVQRINGYDQSARLDLQRWAADLAKEFAFMPITLAEPQPSQPEETTRLRKNEWDEQYEQKIYKIQVTVPFDGDWRLFECYGGYSEMVYPKLDLLAPGKIRFTVILTDLDEQKYRSEVNSVLRDIQSNLPTLHSEVAPWNAGLLGFIEDLIKKRVALVGQKQAFMAKIGLKVNPASDTYMVPPPVAKKTIPKPVTETSASLKTKPVAVLPDAVHTDIKQVLYNVGRAIERKPSLYTGRGEEDLRDIFLLFLETRYESTAGVGEAFNRRGKTDILLKYAPDGTNLFIAECKFWKGAKMFHETIDQLFRYLTTRDSKAALMIFVNQKEFQGVINSVKEEAPKHPQYRKHVRDTYESSIAYEFSLPDDSEKPIQIEVMLFHFPKI